MSVDKPRPWGSWVFFHTNSRVSRFGCGSVGGAEVRKELDQGGHFGRTDLFAVGRHVAATWSAVADLIDQLISRQAAADHRQIGAALAADTIQCMAIAASFVLKQCCALKPQWRAIFHH